MSVAAAFARHVHYSRGVLRVCDDLYQFDSYARVTVISFGVFAHDMVGALCSQTGSLAGGIVSAPAADAGPQLPGFRYFRGGHPLPDSESLRAAEAILKTLSALDGRSLVIYLISPGSSLVEAPEDREISIDDMASLYTLLSESEASSHEAKTVLKHISAVKGGRMALAANGAAQQVSILFPTSADGALDSLAGGPTSPDASNVDDCYRIAARYNLVEKFPATVRDMFQHHALAETPDKDHPAFHNGRWWPISS